MENIAEDKIDSFVIHASVPQDWRDASVWAWDYESGRDASKVWPGITLQSEGNGWLRAELPFWVNSIILCGNRGSVQSNKISFRPREIWVIVTGDLRCDLSYSMPDLISVYAKVPVFWRSPHLWAWQEGGKNAFYSWPGGLMVNEGEYFRLSAPAWVDHIIINGKDGQLKTGDIAIEQGKNVYVNVNRQGDYSLSYEEMEAPPREPVPEFVPLETEKPKAEQEAIDTSEANAGNHSGPLKKAAIIGVVLIAAATLVLAVHFKHNKHKKNRF